MIWDLIWDLFGIYLGSIWDLLGIYLGFTWDPHVSYRFLRQSASRIARRAVRGARGRDAARRYCVGVLTATPCDREVPELA